MGFKKLKILLIFSLSVPSLKSFFSKEKGKKESPGRVAIAANGRAISPAGWRSHYALVRAAATTFGALFFVFLKKAPKVYCQRIKNGKKHGLACRRREGIAWLSAACRKTRSVNPAGRRCCAARKAGEAFRRGGNDEPVLTAREVLGIRAASIRRKIKQKDGARRSGLCRNVCKTG
jgi:hypothetical protein